MKQLSALLFALAMITGTAHAGPYAPAVTNPLTTAFSATSSAFLGWATGFTNYVPGIDEENNEEYVFDPLSQNPAFALGNPHCSFVAPYDVITLGGGGCITLTFSIPIADGGGFDFAIFENAISDFFLELAYVEVSSDGAYFVRFPTASLTAQAIPTYPTYTNGVDASNIDGLAGKYRAGFGTPFDLAVLDDDPGLDKQNVRFVRVVDIIGDGRCRDTLNRPIYDPYPTFGFPGFDLDAIGIINTRSDLACSVSNSGATLTFTAYFNRTYTVQWAESLPADTWNNLTAPFTGNNLLNSLTDPGATGFQQRFYRVRVMYQK